MPRSETSRKSSLSEMQDALVMMTTPMMIIMMMKYEFPYRLALGRGAVKKDTLCKRSIYSSAGTLQLNNRRLTGYLEQATCSPRLGNRSVIGYVGKVQI